MIEGRDGWLDAEQKLEAKAGSAYQRAVQTQTNYKQKHPFKMLVLILLLVLVP
jgi:hypothetical protein